MIPIVRERAFLLRRVERAAAKKRRGIMVKISVRNLAFFSGGAPPPAEKSFWPIV
jgi:hypothetical protein